MILFITCLSVALSLQRKAARGPGWRDARGACANIGVCLGDTGLYAGGRGLHHPTFRVNDPHLISAASHSDEPCGTVVTLRRYLHHERVAPPMDMDGRPECGRSPQGKSPRAQRHPPDATVGQAGRPGPVQNGFGTDQGSRLPSGLGSRTHHTRNFHKEHFWRQTQTLPGEKGVAGRASVHVASKKSEAQDFMTIPW